MTALSVDQLRAASVITVDYTIGHCEDLDVLRVLAAQYRTAMLGQHYFVDHLIAGECESCQRAEDECDGDYACDAAKRWARQYRDALAADRIIPAPTAEEATA